MRATSARRRRSGVLGDRGGHPVGQQPQRAAVGVGIPRHDPDAGLVARASMPITISGSGIGVLRHLLTPSAGTDHRVRVGPDGW